MKIKLLSKNAKKPTRASSLSAGYDLYVPNNTVIQPGRNVVSLDFALSLLPGWEAHIRPRSGFSAKGMEGHKISEPGLFDIEPTRFDADVIQGTIDADYRGNVGVIIKSFEQAPFVVSAGTRIAQMVIGTHYSGSLDITSEINETERAEGGFGSTGTH